MMTDLCPDLGEILLESTFSISKDLGKSGLAKNQHDSISTITLDYLERRGNQYRVAQSGPFFLIPSFTQNFE